MKILFIIAVVCFFGINAVFGARPERGQMKGMELYSWNEDGNWVFVLVPGTNRLKSEEELKKSPNRIDSLMTLRARFMELAKGEHVVWNFHFVPGFSFPDTKTFSQVVAAAKGAEINLLPDRMNEKG